MGTSYLPAKPDVVDVVNEVMREYHPELVQAGVTVNTLMAFGDLKLNGYPAAATVKINAVQQRIEGLADATIKLHSETWRDLTDRERVAVVDHELHHLVVAVEGYREEKVPLDLPDQPDAVKVIRHPIYASDDAGRPKLKMRKHDLVVGGFRVIAERHGRSALEAQHVKACHESLRQLTLWGDDQAGPTEEEQEAAASEATAEVAKPRRRKAGVA